MYLDPLLLFLLPTLILLLLFHPLPVPAEVEEEDDDSLVIAASLDGSIRAFSRHHREASQDEQQGGQGQQGQGQGQALGAKLRWSNKIGGAIVRSYQAKDSLETGVVVPGEDGSIFLFLGGKLQRFALSVVDFVDNSPMYEELPSGKRLAIVGDKTSRIFQLDSATGSIVHSYDPSILESEQTPESQAAESTIMIGREDYRVRAFDIETKQEVWNFTFGKFRPLSGEAISPDDLFSSPSRTKDTSLVATTTTTAPPDDGIAANNKIPSSPVNQEKKGLLQAIGPSAPVRGSNMMVPYSFLEPKKKNEDAKSITIRSFNLEDGPQLYASSSVEGPGYYSDLLPGGTTAVVSREVVPESKSISMCTEDPNVGDCELIVGSTHSVVPRHPRKVRSNKSSTLLDLDLQNPVNAQMITASSNVMAETVVGVALAIGVLLFLIYDTLRRQLQSQKQQPHEELKTISSSGENLFGVTPTIAVNATTLKVGKLELFMNKIKGHGCNGTIVVEGRLDERPVAVKRMLKTLYVDASKEIDILIRSDGHPNVVRYFSKEESFDFVYLALELCSMSMDMAMSKGHEARQRRINETAPAITPTKSSKPTSALIKRPSEATLQFIREICGATKHLHDLQIVHCDIKPQNILVVPRRTGDPEKDELGASWIPKLSDMGLGRKISDQQSSFTSFHSLQQSKQYQSQRVLSTSSSSSSQGVGTAGWRAPELLLHRNHRSSIEGDTLLTSPSAETEDQASRPPRLSRKVDIFSLGCVIYYVIDEGVHPFGAPYERESRIVKGEHDLSNVKHLSEVHSLICAALDPDPRSRPSIDMCLSHPMLWSDLAKINFLCEISDRLEDETQTPLSKTPLLSKVEDRALEIVGPQGWINRLHPLLHRDAEENRFRNYDASSLRDLLRFLRNKKAHHRDMDDEQQKLLSIPDGFVREFLSQKAFPNLLAIMYNLALNYLFHEKEIARYLGEAAIETAAKQRDALILDEPTAPQRSWFAKTDEWIEASAVISASASRIVPKNFKRILCTHYERTSGMRCPVGDKCGFAHSIFELRKADGIMDLNRKPIEQL